MADKKYYKALKRDDKIFQFVNTFWELMKLCDDPEIREMYQMLYKAFDKHDGKAEDVRRSGRIGGCYFKAITIAKNQSSIGKNYMIAR